MAHWSPDQNRGWNGASNQDLDGVVDSSIDDATYANWKYRPAQPRHKREEAEVGLYVETNISRMIDEGL